MSRQSATATIAAFIKKRVAALKSLHINTYNFIDDLTPAQVHALRAYVQGNLMRVERLPSGLISVPSYAANTLDHLFEIFKMRKIPRMPLAYTVYRAIGINDASYSGHDMYQLLPFSTSFKSSVAIEFLLDNIQSSCCIFEIKVPAGTPVLMMGLPPFTRLTPENASKFYPMTAKLRTQKNVDDGMIPDYNIDDTLFGQHECLVEPYKLHVRKRKTKQLRHLLQEQIDHYGYKNVRDVLLKKSSNKSGLIQYFKGLCSIGARYDKRKTIDAILQCQDYSITVYECELVPIEVYMVKEEISPDHSSDEPYTNTYIFTPDQVDPNMIKTIMKGPYTVTKVYG